MNCSGTKKGTYDVGMSTGTNAKLIKTYKMMARTVTPGKNEEEMEELEN